jgi:hypothetical protein
MKVDAVLVIGGGVDEIVGEARDRGKFLARLGVEIGVADAAIDRAVSDADIGQTGLPSKLPIFLGQLGELQTLLRRMDAADAPSTERGVRVLILDELLRSTMEDMQKGIATAYYGNPDGSLNRAVGTAFTEMMSASTSFLDSLQSKHSQRRSRWTWHCVDRAYL